MDNDFFGKEVLPSFPFLVSNKKNHRCTQINTDNSLNNKVFCRDARSRVSVFPLLSDPEGIHSETPQGVIRL